MRRIDHHLTILVALLALTLPAALAAGQVEVDVSAVPFVDLDANDDLVGVDLVASDGGLTLVFVPGGEGALGDAIASRPNADAYTTNALGDVIADAAAFTSGLLEAYPGGFLFVLDAADARAAASAFAERLADLGFAVAPGTGPRVVDVEGAGAAYRASFHRVDEGVRVYLGVR